MAQRKKKARGRADEQQKEQDNGEKVAGVVQEEAQTTWRKLLYNGDDNPLVAQSVIDLEELVLEDIDQLAGCNTVEEEVQKSSASQLDSRSEATAAGTGLLDEATYMRDAVEADVTEKVNLWKKQMYNVIDVNTSHTNAKAGETFAPPQNSHLSQKQRKRKLQIDAELDIGLAMMLDNESADSEEEESLARAQLTAQQLAGVAASAGEESSAAASARLPNFEQPKFGTLLMSMKQAGMFVAFAAARSAPYRVFPGGSNKHRVWVCGSQQSAAGFRVLADEKRKDETEPHKENREHGARARAFFAGEGCKAVIEVQEVKAASLVRGSYRKSGFLKVCQSLYLCEGDSMHKCAHQ